MSTESAAAHIEQMALVTGVNETFVRDEMRRNNYPQNMGKLRDAFIRYILKIDAGRVAIPKSSAYEQVVLARRQIERMLVGPRIG